MNDTSLKWLCSPTVDDESLFAHVTLRSNSGDDFQEIETYLAASMEHVDRNCEALLHLFIAHYLQLYRINRHVENLHLLAAEVRGCGVFGCRSVGGYLCVPMTPVRARSRRLM